MVVQSFMETFLILRLSKGYLRDGGSILYGDIFNIEIKKGYLRDGDSILYGDIFNIEIK